MADQTTSNRASRMEKAEGDRDTQETTQDDANRTSQGAAHPGITNRSDEEESGNQRRVPPRGHEKGEENQ
jgi:hypothetical protein